MQFEGRIETWFGKYFVRIPIFNVAAEHTQLLPCLVHAVNQLQTTLALEFHEFTQIDLVSWDVSRGTFLIGARDEDLIRSLTAVAIRRLRKKYGLSFRDAAERAHMASHGLWRRYERGERVPSIIQLDKLLRAICDECEPILKIAG